jgi:hypothetical protein
VFLKKHEGNIDKGKIDDKNSSRIEILSRFRFRLM